MPATGFSTEDSAVVRRALEATFQLFAIDFEARMGIPEEAMHRILDEWPNVDDTSDGSDACLAINNALNDLLYGVGVSDELATELTSADRAKLQRIYEAWAHSRGWSATGVR